MSRLRKTRRLLLLAQKPDAWHKRFYGSYYPLIGDGYVGWVIGMAYLTPKGERLLDKLNIRRYNDRCREQEDS